MGKELECMFMGYDWGHLYGIMECDNKDIVKCKRCGKIRKLGSKQPEDPER